MKRLSLPVPEPLTMPLDAALKNRTSAGAASASSTLSLADLGVLFGHALGVREGGVRRQYPSGGALYPIESYFIAEKLVDAPGGVYHYHPKAHALEYLWELPAQFTMTDLLWRADQLLPAGLVVFTSMWARSGAKYGDLAYQHALLEAGHMSQNVLLTATARGLHARPMAGFDDAAVIELLDLDETLESPVHAITLSSGAESIRDTHIDD